MRFRHLHEVNFALVSGTVIKKGLFDRRNGKKAVRFSVENIQVQKWGSELVQFKTVVYCIAFGEIARMVWTGINEGDRVFVQGSISWKPTGEMRSDLSGVPYGVQSVLVSDLIRMKGDDLRVPTWGATDVPDYKPSKPANPTYPEVPVGHMGDATSRATTDSKP